MQHLTQLFEDSLERNRLKLLVSLNEEIVEQLRLITISNVHINTKRRTFDYYAQATFKFPNTSEELVIHLMSDEDAFKSMAIFPFPTYLCPLKDSLSKFIDGVTIDTPRSTLKILYDIFNTFMLEVWNTLNKENVTS